jgi:hypothetical protein
MNPLIELDQLTLDSADKSQLKAWVQTLVSQAHETAVQLQAKDAEIKRKDFKIEALTFELARLRRIQFGVKNETLSPLQRDLFAETLAADSAAIEVELEQLAEVERVPRWPSPNALVPVVNRCPIICPALSTAMNRSHVSAASAVTPWSKSVKTSPSNWMWNRPSSLCIGTFARNTPAAGVKPSPRPRFHRR